MPQGPSSIARRLLLSVAVPSVLFFGLTIAIGDLIFRQLSESAMRELLNEQIVALITAADIGPQGEFEVNLLDPESRLDLPSSGQYASVCDENGTVLWQSPSLAGTGIQLGGRLPAGGTDFFYRNLKDGSQIAELRRALQWEYARGKSERLVLTAANSTAPQLRQLRRLQQQMFGWFALLTLALLGTLAWRVRRALAPVRLLEKEIAAVESGALQQLSGSYPRELAGVTKNLNALLTAERSRNARYRDTLGNLAHSLKTPLAVIHANLASTPAEQRSGIEHEVDRMAQIVEHQLKRAAAAGSGMTLGQGAAPLLPIVNDLRAALLKVHARKDLVIDIDVPPDVGFLGDRDDITEMLGNVLDNACKWCRLRVHIRASLESARALPWRLSITVDDDGAGIAAADRARIFERGTRADEHVPGHGLGLAMVRETVALYGGRLFVDASHELGGARVELQLPGR
ncbi:MAG: ATP-binding protein [Steroidobacterales bacterium]